MAYVYRHIRCDKNQPFYIGVGVDSEGNFTRAYDFHKSRRNIIWNKIFNKTELEVDILIDGISPEQAKDKEIEFIKLYGRRDLGQGTLVNKTNGGDALPGLIFTDAHKKKLSNFAKGRVISEEQKQKLRELRIGKEPWNKGLSGAANPLFGRKLSEESKQKGSAAKIGVKNPMYGKKGLASKSFKGFIEVYKDAVFVGRFEGVYAVAKELSVDATKVSACLLGKRNHTKGYTFKRISKGEIL